MQRVGGCAKRSTPLPPRRSDPAYNILITNYIDSWVKRLHLRELHLYLSEGGSWGPEDLVDGINGYADYRGQSHGEADSQRPAGINIVVVGDGLVLDHRENQDELGRERERET